MENIEDEMRKNSHLDESQFKPKTQISHNYSHRYRSPKASTTICHFILNPEGEMHLITY